MDELGKPDREEAFKMWIDNIQEE